MEIKNRDIIVIGIQPWDIEIGSNCKNIALEFSKNNRVLYVNQPLDRKSKKAEKGSDKIEKRLNVLKGRDDDLEKIQDNLWNLNPKTMIESINFIPTPSIYNYLNRKNNKKLAKQIKSAINRLNFENFILFNDSSMFLGLHQKELLKPDKFIYYIRDNLVKNPYWAKHGVRLEPEIIKKADVVTTNSIYYANYAKKWNPHSYMVGQGCDVSLFNDEKGDIPVADEMQSIQKPIIGYVGFLSSRRLDLEIISHIASQRKDWNVVLVGPEDDVFKASDLHNMENVHFLGSKEPDTLPTYIKGFDICINPQIVNDATIGNYPRKIDEYLAMGKPTIATQTEAMDYFKEHVYLGKSKEDYIDLIDKALNEDNKELQSSRRTCALSHTWANNVANIWESLKKSSK
jgi:glycosyltransferase involved in cell wall biosynthesis